LFRLFAALTLSLFYTGPPVIALATRSQPANYFVDCGSTATSGSGLAAESPWTTLEQVNGSTFQPGDTIRFKRNSRCHGRLWPKGSGSEARPIRLTAYGTGARPQIIADRQNDAALKLFNQQYWEIDSLDFSGSQIHGVFISGDRGVLHHIHLANLLVHDVGGEKIAAKETGLVIISPGAVNQHFDDVLVDGVEAYQTSQWAGILVGGGDFGMPPENTWSTRVVIRNSTVHDVQGDGIVLFRVRDGRIAANVAWKIGMQPTETIGTPNAIWTWMCRDCVVEQNEAFLTDSPGVDGGAFDIDYGNTNNAVLNNYGHDTQGYCVAVFAAGSVTHQSKVRGNTCLNNARSPRLAEFQGAIFIHTWNEGKLDEVTVENNVVYWAPPGGAPAIVNDASLEGGRAIVQNNRIYSFSPRLVSSNASLEFQGNRYTLFSQDGMLDGIWRHGDRTYSEFTKYQNESGQDKSGGYRRAVATQLNATIEVDGRQREAASAYRRLLSMPMRGLEGRATKRGLKTGEYAIYAFLPSTLDANGLLNEASRRQLVILKSLESQFCGNGLKMVIVFVGHQPRNEAARGLQNVIADGALNPTQIAYLQDGGQPNLSLPLTLLVSPKVKAMNSWQGFAGAAAIGVAVRRKLGDPQYARIGMP
jgi:hypothetical protein